MIDIKKINYNFKRIKKLLESNNIKKCVDGFYFNEKAVDIIDKAQINYFLNNYNNLTTSNILNLIYNNKNVKEVKNTLFLEYNDQYANAWYDNFLEILNNIKRKK